jgi:hypothetical protein
VGGGDFQDVIAFLPQRRRYAPRSLGRDVQQDYPDAQVLHFGDDLGEVFFGTDDDGVTDRVVPGQRGQVAMDLSLDAFPAPGPHPSQTQFKSGQVSQHVVLSGPASLDRGLVPVATQQRQPGPVSRQAREQLQQAGIVPGNRIAAVGAVDGHCAICEHIARVHEQRAAIHATPSLPSTRDVTSAWPSS